jgi:hypothetical protein
MPFKRGTDRPLESERGYLEVAGREADRPLRDILLKFRDLVAADMEWVDNRRRTRCRFNRLRDELDYYIVATPAAELSRERLREFFDRHQVTWADASRQWVEFRKLDRPPQPESRT